MNASELPNLFTRTPGRVHIMGICGVGAAGVAWMLHLRGWKVSGCDRHIPPTLGAFFAKNGIAVWQDHAPAHLKDCDALVYSAAVSPNEPELALARAGGLTVLSRGECLAGWVSGLRSVSMCGTHGKTTTSCFLTRLLQCIGQKPLWCLGGYTSRLLTNAGPRHNDLTGSMASDQLAVAEADESDGSLAYEHPAVTVITNIDLDHLDHFRDGEEIERCFATVVENTREAVAVCADAPRAMRVAARFRGPVLSYGFSEEAALRAEIIHRDALGTTFILWQGNDRIADISLPVPGDHNVLNALGALAAARLLGFDVKVLAETLSQACDELPKRRFQWMTPRDAAVRVVMDYAHHPTEIQAMLSMARLQNPKRLRVVFQPHRYSRTLRLMDQFVGAFEGVQELILLPVYAASEHPVPGGMSHDLYAELRRNNPIRPLLLARDVGETVGYLRRTARTGDLILVVGAGDVERVAHELKEGPTLPLTENRPFQTLSKLLPDEAQLEPNASLAPYSFYRVGGCAELIAAPRDVPALSALRLVCKTHGIPVRFHGCGSNTWFSDFGLPGVLCVLSSPVFSGYRREGEEVEIGAGMVGAELLARLERDGLSGLEFMQGIPGTIGGWTRMNAGAHGHAFWERVTRIRAITDDGQLRHLPAQAVTAGYRSVIGLSGLAIIGVTLRLTAATPEHIKSARHTAAAARADFAGLRCCGSLFRNPEGQKAGMMLDALGAKAWRIGGAFVAPHHANVIAAGEGCTASDLLALTLRLQGACQEAYGIVPEPEVQGFA